MVMMCFGCIIFLDVAMNGDQVPMLIHHCHLHFHPPVLDVHYLDFV